MLMMNIRQEKLYKEWEGLCDLNDIKPEDDAIICGSAILYAKKINEKIRDMDIMITNQEVWHRLLKKYPLQKSNSTDEEVIIWANGKIEIKDTFLSKYDFVFDELNDVEIIDGIRFLSLQKVKDYKIILNRKKDQQVLKLIETYEKRQSGFLER